MKSLLCFAFLLATLVACNQDDKNETTNEQISAKIYVGCKPQATDKDWYASGKKAPMFEGLNGIIFPISTNSKEAQDYFNQGMMLSYGFNHAEAARSFYQAIRADSNCAMCYWGYAYVLGPNYNAGMEADNFQRAYDAAQKARSLSKNATAKEKALINALTLRYAEQPPADRNPLDVAYSRAMKKLYQQFASDPDVRALYAESLMNLHPWDLYDKDSKSPKPWTPELLTILERLMRENPRHPGAHHFYIHAVEASAAPERGLASAKLFETLVPGSGHLVHMPSHIYINTGDYHQGSLSNINAVKIDSSYITACHAQGAYPLAYYPHNYHFLAATATLEGSSQMAWMAAKKVQQHTATDIMREPGWGTLQHYYTIPYYVATKFAMWDTILSLPMPAKDLVYPRAVLHYARGLAFTGKGDMNKAEKEYATLQSLASDTSLKSLTIWGINSTFDLMQIATNVLAAEIAATKKDYGKSISLLKEAIAIEDGLNYDEPPDWFFSVRHHLGTVYLKVGKFAEAENTYHQDLKKLRKNGWALIGLYHALDGQGKKDEAQKAKVAFDNAWQYADIKINSSSPL